jgi:DNA repair protein RadC
MSTNGDAITARGRHDGESPRARFFTRGAAALSDAELLALALRARHVDRALAVARRLLARFGSIAAVLAAGPQDLLGVAGVDAARVATLGVVLELALRATAGNVARAPVFGASSDVSRYLRMRLGRCRREVFGVLFLDSQHRLIEYRALFFGTVDSATVHPREVLRAAMDVNAAAVILAHNHPSGVAEPSRADVALTERLRSVLSLVDIRVLDHLVVVPAGTVSFAERGLL